MRAHFVRPVTDFDGVPLRTCTVSVYRSGTRQLLPDTLYWGPSGSVELPNPFTITNGMAEFFLEQPQTVSIGLQSVGSSSIIENLDVLPPTETMVTSPNGLTIGNDPNEGQFLQADGLASAHWVDAEAITSTKASPLQILGDYAYNPITGDTGLRVTDVNGNPVVPTYVDAPSGVPDGFHVNQAVQVPVEHTVTFATGPLTFPEPGWIEFCYYTVATDPLSAAGLRADVDTGQPAIRMPQTADMLGIWRVGYLGGIGPGTHTVHLAQLPGTDEDSYVLLGELRVYYGTNIPFHTHGGAEPNSTLLGPDATADHPEATAIGGAATVTGRGGTAFGARSAAALEATAFGAYASAGPYGTAFGHGAANTLGSEGGLAGGRGAQTQADNAVALGRDALASGTFAVALGNEARAANFQSVAVGSVAAALAANSAAVGPGSWVSAGHAGSMAFGANSATTAANQLMLGTASTAVTVPGDLTLFGSTVLGSASSTLGFYGASGTAQPVVTGSRGGNATLASLLSSLAAMGLIADSTEA